MVKEGTKYTVMLCGMGFVYDAQDMGFEFSDQEAWSKRGEVRLKESFVQGLAEESARKLKGKVLRHWFDNGAGGYYAEIEVPANTSQDGVENVG